MARILRQQFLIKRLLPLPAEALRKRIPSSAKVEFAEMVSRRSAGQGRFLSNGHPKNFYGSSTGLMDYGTGQGTSHRSKNI